MRDFHMSFTEHFWKLQNIDIWVDFINVSSEPHYKKLQITFKLFPSPCENCETAVFVL